MSQVSKYPISKTITDRIFEIFAKTLINIKNENDANLFVTDLLTPTEKIMLAKRLAIAYLLEKNYDYQTIKQIIKVSSGTVASVNIARKYGNNGYKKLLNKINEDEKLQKLVDEAISKILSVPSELERGKGTWSYLKRETEKHKRKNKKAF